MQSSRRAVIDIGTNSVKLLVGEVEASVVSPIWEESEQTRLGRGFYETHQLQAAAISHTADVVSRFAQHARDRGASNVHLIATSAARDAENREELVSAIRNVCGLTIEIISGEQEAEWAFQGVSSDPRFHGHQLMILDVGGGSTEIIVGEKGHHSFSQSFLLGSVRLLEKFTPTDPPSTNDLENCRKWLGDFFDHEVAPAIESRLHSQDRHEIRLVGTGGTTTILARLERRMNSFDRSRIEETSISREHVAQWMRRLWSTRLSERREIIGMPANRADIIPFGVAIYEAVMDHFGFSEVFVSTRGLRFGALLAGSNPSGARTRRARTPG